MARVGVGEVGGVRPGEIWTCHGGLEVLKVWGDGGMGGGAMIWCFFWYGGGGWYKLWVVLCPAVWKLRRSLDNSECWIEAYQGLRCCVFCG